MKRISRDKQQQEIELRFEQEKLFNLSEKSFVLYPDRSPVSTDINPLLINCCKKCTCHHQTTDCISLNVKPLQSKSNCYLNHCRNNRRINYREVKMRLKEKSKKKLEEKSRLIQQQQNTNPVDDSILPDLLEVNNQTTGGDPNESSSVNNNIDSPNSTPNKSRNFKKYFNENVEKTEDVCTLKFDCHCKTCLQRQKLMEELIAEEESSKKKKQRKKKKSRGSSQQSKSSSSSGSRVNPLEEEDSFVGEDDSLSLKSSQETSETNTINNKCNNKSNNKGKSDEITSSDNTLDVQTKNNNKKDNDIGTDQSQIDIHQWIKVKNKYAKHSSNSILEHWDLGVDDGENSNKMSQSSDLEFDLENNGFKLINSDKRRNSNAMNTSGGRSSEDLLLQKEMASINVNDFVANYVNSSRSMPTNTNSITVSHKAKLLAMDANLAYLRGELKEALKLITESIDLNQKEVVYYINRSFYYEKLNEFEHSLSDAENAIRIDENGDFLECSLYRKAKALAGLDRYEESERTLNSIKASEKLKRTPPMIMKDLLLVRLKRLVSDNYTLPLARLYASKYDSIDSAMEAIQDNCNTLIDSQSNDLDLKLHLSLIRAHLKNLNKQYQDKDKTIENSEDEESLEEDDDSNDYKLNCNGEDNNDDDSEIYFSDEDEYDIVYSNPEKWLNPKDILQKYPVQLPESKDLINSKGQKALWIGNISPNCSLSLVTNLFMKFGTVTFCKIFPNERANEVAYLLLHYDNDISPRLVMSYFKDKVIPGVSKEDFPLVIRFRNKNDKLGEDSTEGSTSVNIALPNSNMGQTGATIANTAAAAAKAVSECYYWRTTGCDRERCQYKHVSANKGIDRQSWMRRKN